MKKLLSVLVLSAIPTLALAQAMINFANGSQRLCYLTADTTRLLPADISYALYAVPFTRVEPADAGGLFPAGASGAMAYVDLWGGSAPDNMTLQTTVTAWTWTWPGQWANQFLTLSNMAPGAKGYFQIVVRDSRILTGTTIAEEIANCQNSTFMYYGSTPQFTMYPQSAAANLYNTAAPYYSTWPAGTQALVNSDGLGEIMISANVPEPSMMALAALGAAALLIFRRRQSFRRR